MGTAAVLILWGQPLSLAVVCLALAGLAAVAIAAPFGTGALGLASAVPAGFVLLVAWGMSWGLLCGVAGVGAWSSRTAGLVGVLVYSAVTGATVLHRGGRVRTVGRDAAGILGFLGLGGFFVWVIATQSLSSWSRVNSTGTDFMRHLGFLRDVRQSGSIPVGELTYPRALHALGAWLSGVLGTDTDADTLWRAMAPVGFLMLCLMVMSIMVLATRLTDLLEGATWAGPIASVLAGAAFVQTAWFDSFLALGAIMNMLVALSLLALLVFGLDAGNFAATAGAVVCASALAVVGNAWQFLLPVIGMAAIPWITQFFKHGLRRPVDWAAWAIGAVLVMQGAGLLSSGSSAVGAVASTSSMVSVSLLFRPDWWWFVALATALVTCALVFARGWRLWAASFAGLSAGLVGTVAFLMHLTGSGWDLMMYYPVKALWTGLVVVIPVASAGAVVIARAAWRTSGAASRLVRTAARVGIVAVVFVIMVGVLGRSFAFPPHVAVIAQGPSDQPNWSLAVIETLGRQPVDHDDQDGALVFGLVPGADVSLARGTYLGAVDSMAMEAIAEAGVPGARSDPIKGALMKRDMGEICRYLTDHRQALRITGPNRKAGPEWIIDSGCPREVVAPERWISLDFAQEWLDRSPWEGGEWIFPDYPEVAAETTRA
jgi:hypothetical protein